MSRWVAPLDANVLYPAPVRDLMPQLAVADMFHAKWSADIHREWIDALLRNEPRRDRGALERTRDLMDTATRDCLVTGYESLISTLSLPDTKDRHVMAAAITGRCEVIVTQNLRHFPEVVLQPFGIEACHPDALLLERPDLAPATFFTAVSTVRKRLRHPPYAAQDYLNTLARAGLPELRPGAVAVEGRGLAKWSRVN